MTEALDTLCTHLGVAWRFRDGSGIEREAPLESRKAVIAALGFDAADAQKIAQTINQLEERRSARMLPPYLILTPDKPVTLEVAQDAGQWSLILETGELFEGVVQDKRISLPHLDLGLHTLSFASDSCTLIVAPDRVAAPPRRWGLTAPLYGLRTADQGGLGTYRDLGSLMEVAGSVGASFVGINPVHAGFPEDANAFSPYSPSSRRFYNILHVDVGETHSHDGDLIDYPTVISAQMEALNAAFIAFDAGADTKAQRSFTEFVEKGGDELRRFALHQSISEVYGAFWPTWPAAYQHPNSPEVTAFCQEHDARVRFHSWLQWMADRQLDEAQTGVRNGTSSVGRGAQHHEGNRQDIDRDIDRQGMGLGLYLDLAVGTNPAGAETWAHPEMFALGATLGAPPDAFSPVGQDWGIAPLNPLQMIEDGFRYFAEILRCQFRHAGVIRIDHILGFERAFWCPQGMPGAYVTMPKDAMLAVARLEATRAGALIVGEDLGNVADGFRRDLAQSGILGCSVALFERNWDGDEGFYSSAHYRPDAMASFATHDLPTWAGWRCGRDIDWRVKTGQIDADEGRRLKTERDVDVARFDATLSDFGATFDGMTEFLAVAAAGLVAIQIEDVLALEEQANLPGTIHDHPNWRRRLPTDIGSIAEDPRLSRVGEIMRQAGRSD